MSFAGCGVIVFAITGLLPTFAYKNRVVFVLSIKHRSTVYD